MSNTNKPSVDKERQRFRSSYDLLHYGTNVDSNNKPEAVAATGDHNTGFKQFTPKICEFVSFHHLLSKEIGFEETLVRMWHNYKKVHNFLMNDKPLSVKVL